MMENELRLGHELQEARSQYRKALELHSVATNICESFGPGGGSGCSQILRSANQALAAASMDFHIALQRFSEVVLRRPNGRAGHGERQEHMLNGAPAQARSTAEELRLESTRLRLGFLEAEIENSFVIASLAKTSRSLGYHEAAKHGMARALKGYQMAKYLHRTLPGVDPARMASLAARLDALDSELGSNSIPDWFPLERTAEEQAMSQGRHLLTARESEVLGLIVEGKSTKELAFALGISFKTAVTHRSNIMTKLGAANTAALVRKAIVDKLVPVQEVAAGG